MTTLREAAQQALEALKGYRRELGDQQPCDAEQALEAALAEPDSDSPERRCGGPGCDLKCCQPVQEPVAYSEGRTLHWHDGKGVNDAQLYLAPPQRKPLSGVAIYGLFVRSGLGAYHQKDFVVQTEYDRCIERFARAAERAHGIGGEE